MNNFYKYFYFLLYFYIKSDLNLENVINYVTEEICYFEKQKLESIIEKIKELDLKAIIFSSIALT